MAFELCKGIEGLPRHMGMHCAGVVISPGSLPLADLVPLGRAARDPTMAITQYDKDAIESLGLVKMDLLGSRALTTLVDTLQAVGVRGEGLGVSRDKGSPAGTNPSPLTPNPSWGLEAIPFDDERTYKMMAEGETLGCFQLESPGMRALLKWLRPRSLNDVTAAISLFRPGPLEGGFMETFMRRHLGLEPVSYPHPAMEPILKDTYGVILYQEQFLRLAHSLAGLDLGEAEKLRKELGEARTPEERARMGSVFVAGAIERGIDQMQAEKVWEIIAGYTGFGFCQAHACSYAVTAYRSAYMKAHYPAQFLAAQLNNQGGYYGPSVYVEDARRLRIKLLPPHVNESGAWCEAVASGEWRVASGRRQTLIQERSDGSSPLATRRAIRIGLQFVQGLSRQTISALLTERHSGGPFRSLVDLMGRVEMTPPEATALVKVGACDGLRREGSDLPHLPRIEALRGSLGESVGAFHGADFNRRQLLWLLPQIVSARNPRSRGESVRFDLFSKATGSDGPGVQGVSGVSGVQVMMGDFRDYGSNPRVLGKNALRIDVPNMDDYTRAEKLRLEQEVLGFALSGNEMELYQEALNEQGVVSALRLSAEGWGPGTESGSGYSRPRRGHPSPQSSALVSVAGTMVAGRRHLTKSGEWMLFITLQDLSGLVEVVLFPDAFRENAKVIANGGYGPYLVRGQVQASGRLPSVAVVSDQWSAASATGPTDHRPTSAARARDHSSLRSSDAASMKMHPVVIAHEVTLLPGASPR